MLWRPLTFSVAWLLAGCGQVFVQHCTADGDCRTGLTCVSSICTDSRQPCTPGRLCRSSAGACDLEETCGDDGFCPPDQFATGVCRSVRGPCDVEESCTGASALCPADGLASTSVKCRDAAGPCDSEEFCSGTAAECPVDTFKPSSTVCRAASDAGCDVSEHCDGSSSACPANGFADAGTICRTTQAPCDAEDVCTGSSDVCPDLQKQTGDACTPASSANCTRGPCLPPHQEVCAGTCGGDQCLNCSCQCL